jgi:hypothetical protein
MIKLGENFLCHRATMSQVCLKVHPPSNPECSTLSSKPEDSPASGFCSPHSENTHRARDIDKPNSILLLKGNESKWGKVCIFDLKRQ